LTARPASTRKGGRLAALALAAVAALGVSLFGGAFSTGGSDRAAAAVTPVDQEALAGLVQGLSTGDSAALVRKLERRVARNGRDAAALTLLGFAYQQRMRETADTSFLPRSGRAFRRAQALVGDNAVVLAGRAALAVSQHRFADAVPLARQAIRLDPENASAFAALGDALEGLGRYRPAFYAFDRAAELSPSVATYARVAHGRELLGRARAARAAFRIALTLDSAVLEQRAWALVQLAELGGGTTSVADAERLFREALRLQPGYVHALVGLAQIESARGRTAAAVRQLRDAVAGAPYAEDILSLAELLDSLGQDDEARESYALVRRIHAAQRANGVRTELQEALFLADRGEQLRRALALARTAHAARPSIQADDALAWVLVRNGRCAEARMYSVRAHRLGTENALFSFHRGMIERCLGNAETARRWFTAALELDPQFSALWAPVAARYARLSR
jgi:tetratricopeptide (TPR) repeat protein